MAVVAKTPAPSTSAEQRRRRRERIQKLRLAGRAYLWLSPLILAMAVIVYYPLITGLILSFTNADQTNIATQIGIISYPATYKFVGLQNFIHIIGGWFVPGSDEQHVLWQTFIWIVANAAFHFLIGMGLALVLNRKMRFRAIYRTLLMVPWAMPQFVAAFAWLFLFNSQGGYIDAALPHLGLPPVPWLSDPAWALVSVIIVNIWLGIPFMTVTLLGGLQSIPAELYEASAIDGASRWQSFRYVTLPMLRPIAFLVTLIDVIWTFNVFAVIFLITGGGPFNRSHTLFTFAWFQSFQGAQKFALGGAYGMIILVILLVFTIFYSRMLRSNEAVY
jgi:arabinogalactan oligomer/maltooligosaccharide transport system permease protein